VRAPFSGRSVSADEAARRSRDRGRKSTGSYEGSLAMEGIPDHHEPSAFTSRRSRWSRRLSHTPGNAGEGRAHREWKRERRQGCQRLDRIEERGSKNAHAHESSRIIRLRVSLIDPPKRFERRECARSPGQTARSPNSGRCPRGESRGSVAGNVRGAGARSFVRVAEVDQTHRASCPSGGRKAS
jgi:hypothetical protein